MLTTRLVKKINLTCGVKFSYRMDPSNLNWVSKTNNAFQMCQYFPDTNQLALLRENSKNAFELIISSEDKLRAENINGLIYSGRLIYYPVFEFSEYEILSVNESDSFIQTGGNFANLFKQKEISMSLPWACLIAARASNSNLEYALEKYKFSLQHGSFTPHSAHPRHGKIIYTGV